MAAGGSRPRAAGGRGGERRRDRDRDPEGRGRERIQRMEWMRDADKARVCIRSLSNLWIVTSACRRAVFACPRCRPTRREWNSTRRRSQCSSTASM